MSLKVGVAPSLEHRIVLSAVDPDLVVDVGANKGQFSLAVREFLGNVEILAFEPLKIPSAIYLKQKIIKVNSRLYQLALSNQKGELIFNVSKSDDSSSILDISQNQVDIYPGTEKIREESVQVDTLDSYSDLCIGKTCVFLKIDVQGAERLVLEGGEKFLLGVHYVFIELSFIELYENQPIAHEIISFLCKRNFRIKNILNTHYINKSKELIQADFLFEKAS